MTEDAHLYRCGRVVWHSSDDSGMPDVGMSVGLGDGRMLYAGEISDARHAETEGASDIGPALGWWVILYGQNKSTVVGRCVDEETARALIEGIGAAVRLARTA